MQRLSERAKIGFVYRVEHIGMDGSIISDELVHNVIPDVGRDYLLTSSLLNGSQYAAFYIGLYTAARTPLTGDDMASFLTDAEESISYDGVVRLTLIPDALVSGLYSNAGTPAEFDYNTSAETVRGGFITSSASRGASTGLLLSAVLFPTPKIMDVGETLRVTAGIQLVTV